MKNETVERSFLQGLHVSHVHEHRAIERVATWKKRGGELYTHRSIVFARGEEAGDFAGHVAPSRRFCLSVCVCVLWPAFPRKRAQLDQKFRILSLYGEQASRGLEKPAEKVGRELYLWSFSLSLSLSASCGRTQACETLAFSVSLSRQNRVDSRHEYDRIS